MRGTPASANCLAAARPTPEVPPVMTTLQSLSGRGVNIGLLVMAFSSGRVGDVCTVT